MDNPFKTLEFLFVVKDDRSQSVTINSTIRIQDIFAERPGDLPPGWFAWLDNLPRQFIGIDHDGSAFPEHLRHGAFSRGDASCESNQNHGGGAYHVSCPARNRN